MGKKTRKKWIIGILAGVIVLASAGLLFVGNYLVDFAIVRKETFQADIAPESAVTEENRAIMEENSKMIEQKKAAWLSSVSKETVEITSDDDLVLKADVFQLTQDSHNWVIAVHGYKGRRADMQNVAGFYGEKGFHVLTPDMRGHGESEGNYIGMGWLDRKDILKWIAYILSRDEQAQIILHGISMGGATVMMTAGEDLPPQVKGAVEDCGYTSVWDIFSDELDYVFHLPEFPILYAANAVAFFRADYGFKSASALEQVKKSKIPILFIHGSEDNFVHADMAPVLYEACRSEKELLIMPGAGHGDSYRMDPDLYFGSVFSFLERYCLK